MSAAPALPHELRFTRDTYELHIFRWERPDAPRVLLVHGIGMGHSVYQRFISEIASVCDVTAIDLPGFADCPEPADPLSMPATADLVAEALRHHELGPLIAVGHSMGAQIVAELAGRHPELVTRAVLVAPSVNPEERNLCAQARRMVQDLAEGQPFAVYRLATKTYLQAGPFWFMRKLHQMLAHRMEECLPRVLQPALVIRGVDDRVCPRGWAVRVTALLPRGEMLQVEHRGHEALISSGQPVARMVLEWSGIEPPEERDDAPLPRSSGTLQPNAVT